MIVSFDYLSEMTTCTRFQLFVNGNGPVHALAQRRATTDAAISVNNQRGIRAQLKHISSYTCSGLISICSFELYFSKSHAILSVVESCVISVILANS